MVSHQERAQFNPSRLVHLVAEMLAAQFYIPTMVDSASVGPAVNAAADLLWALGVTPANVPELRPAGTQRCLVCGAAGRGEHGRLFHVDGCREASRV